MNHYQQSLVIKASPDTVYAALTTPQGLRGWWTQDCDVDTHVGGTLQFRFGPHYKHMRIEKLEPRSEVRWLCTVAHIDVDRFTRKDEWVGTQLAFHLRAHSEGHTQLDFEHIGLLPTFECHDICMDGWRHFLQSLRLYASTGTGTPYEIAATPTCGASRAGAEMQASA